MAFTHLHVHTEYSLLDGSNKIKEYVARVKELGMNSAAITDHGVMYGVIDFYRAAREAGIKPILGCEVYVAPNSRFDKELTGGEDRYHHLVLLAENNTGYANLMKIVSRGFTEGYYYKPRVDMEVLQEFHEGIIALSACLAGEVPRFILKGMKEEARMAARKYEACFGKGNYFLELQDHGIPEQRTVNMELVQMSRELDIPLVTTNDVHYTYAEDAIPHDILLCLQTGKKLADEDRMRYEGGQYYVKSEEEMKGLFPYAWEAVENTQRIADRCNVEIEFGVTKLPKYDVPEGYDSWSYLNKLCDDGLAERYPDNVRFADLSGRGEQSMVDLQLFASEGGDAAAPSAPALSHAQAQQAIASGTMKADEGREASDVPTPAAVQEPEERPAPPERPAPLPLPPVRAGEDPVRALHARWAAEEAMLRRDMPDFSLKQELANPEMRRLMELPGMRMGDAYRLAHYNDALRQTAQTVEQGVVERIRQRSARPAENGTSPGGAAITRADVASMTRAQREALERRAMHGVKISF